MPVIDVAIGNHVDQLSRFQPGHLGKHHQKHGILAHVPVVGGEHILAALVEDAIEGVSGDIEGHGIGAGIEAHIVQILEIIEVGENPPGGRIVLQVIKHPVYLVKLPLRVLVLDAQLVAVGLADGAVRPCPLVPHVAAQVCNPVGLLLPDPQQLIQGGFPVGAAQGHNGKLLLEIVPVHHAEFLDGMGRGAVLPMGADLLVLVGIAVLQNLAAGFLI